MFEFSLDVIDEFQVERGYIVVIDLFDDGEMGSMDDV
jgi:hypothetical protein